MAWLLRVVSVSFVLLGTIAWPHLARGAEEAITVVDVAPSAAELDAAKLRAAIASELHAHVVAPDDPLAASAKGALRVELDHATGKLTVTYTARSTPIARSIPLPTESGAARAQAVLLAGNLARDEASELVTELRDARPEPPAKADAAAAAAREADARRVVDQQRLDATLVYYGAEAHRDRMTLGWSLLVVGAASEIAGVALAGHSNFTTPLNYTLAPAALASSFWVFILRSPFEDLRTSILRGEGGGLTSAERWANAAQSEHTMRRTTGGVVLALSAIAIAAGAYDLGSGKLSVESPARQEFASNLIVAGVIGGVASAYWLATDGPVENALHAYERTTGQTLDPTEALLDHLSLALGPRGVTGGFRMNF